MRMKIQVYEGTGVDCEDESRLFEERRDHIAETLRDFEKHLVIADGAVLSGRELSDAGTDPSLWCKIDVDEAEGTGEATEASVASCERRVFVMPNMLNGNNYTEGGDVAWANYRALVQQWDHDRIFKLKGEHDSYGVVIPLDLVVGDMREALLGLEDYCVLDEEMHSEVESELQEQEWVNTFREEFVDTLRKSDTLRSSKALDESDLDDEHLIDALRHLLEDHCEVWVPSKGQMGYDIPSMAALVKRVTPEMIEKARKFWS